VEVEAVGALVAEEALVATEALVAEEVLVVAEAEAVAADNQSSLSILVIDLLSNFHNNKHYPVRLAYR